MYTRVAVIGDVAGLVHQLRSCLEGLGVTEETWPEGLHVIQLGDLFGGNDDLACAQLVEPHLLAGRWTQLIGNWELAAVGGPRISRGGVTAQVDALHLFSNWCGEGLVEYATVVRPDRGPPALVTHAGLTAELVGRSSRRRRERCTSWRHGQSMPHCSVRHSEAHRPVMISLRPRSVWAIDPRAADELVRTAPMPVVAYRRAHNAVRPRRRLSPWAPFDLLDQCVVDQRSFHTVFRPLRARPGLVWCTGSIRVCGQVPTWRIERSDHAGDATTRRPSQLR